MKDAEALLILFLMLIFRNKMPAAIYKYSRSFHESFDFCMLFYILQNILQLHIQLKEANTVKRNLCGALENLWAHYQRCHHRKNTEGRVHNNLHRLTTETVCTHKDRRMQMNSICQMHTATHVHLILFL